MVVSSAVFPAGSWPECLLMKPLPNSYSFQLAKGSLYFLKLTSDALFVAPLIFPALKVAPAHLVKLV